MPRPILPIVPGGRAPEPPPAWGGLGEEGWARGATFLQFVDAAGEHRHEIDAAFRDLQLRPETSAFFEAYPRRVRVVALASHGTPECRVQIAQAERLWSLGPRIWMRIFAPEEHPDVVQRLAGAQAAEFPLLVFFGDDRREFARWGPRPAALQHLLKDLPEDEREARIREFQARDRGAALCDEMRALLAAH